MPPLLPPPLSREGRDDRGNTVAAELAAPCHCMTVSGPGVMISPRSGEELLPPPLHAAAHLIKTQTFNKTPHYHNSKTRSRRKKKPRGKCAHFPIQHFLRAFFFFPTRCGSGEFPDANHAVFLYLCVRLGVFSVARGSCRLFSPPLHPFATFSVR